MTTVDWKHIILAASGYSGTSRRIARMRNAGAVFAPPYRERHWSSNGNSSWSPNTVERGQAPGNYGPPFSPLPAVDPYGDRTYAFAFWSIAGSSPNGAPLQTVPDGQTPSIAGDSWTLNAKAWYVLDRNTIGKGDPPGGGPAVEIDAFSETANDFISPDFVDINPDGTPDPGHSDMGPLTFTANEDGYVSTEMLKYPISITAREVIGDGYFRYSFVKWQVVPRFSGGSPMPEVNGNTLTIHPQNTMKAYAIYDTAEVKIPQVDVLPEISVIAITEVGLPILIFNPNGHPKPLDPSGPYELKQVVEMLYRSADELSKSLKS